MKTSAAETYGWTTIALHWLSVVALVISFLTGEVLEGANGDGRGAILASHVFWASLLAIPLLARIGWRLHEGFLSTAEQSRLLKIISRIVMIGLLISICGAVISGFLLPWSLGEPLEIGALSISSPLPRWPALHGLLEGLHGLFAHLWLPLVILHILGALKHLFLDGDQVFMGILISKRER